MIKFKKIIKSRKWLNWTNNHLKDNINKMIINKKSSFKYRYRYKQNFKILNDI